MKKKCTKCNIVLTKDNSKQYHRNHYYCDSCWEMRMKGKEFLSGLLRYVRKKNSRRNKIKKEKRHSQQRTSDTFHHTEKIVYNDCEDRGLTVRKSFYSKYNAVGTPDFIVSDSEPPIFIEVKKTETGLNDKQLERCNELIMKYDATILLAYVNKDDEIIYFEYSPLTFSCSQIN